MKTAQIYVGQPSGALEFTAGKAIGCYPAGKGRDFSLFLLEQGQIVKLKGSRIQRKGVATYLKEHGFTLAPAGNEHAEKLALYADKLEGVEIVEAASQDAAHALNVKFAGQSIFFVPFDRSKDIIPVKMSGPTGFNSVSMDLQNGFSSGLVSVEYVSNYGSHLALNKGWFAATLEEAEALPRFDEGDELIEHAAFTICNSGFGKIKDNLGFHAGASEEDIDAARGKLIIELANGDELHVGGTAVDELSVKYFRNGECIHCSSACVDAVRMGSYVSHIMCVYVRVQEMDAAAALKAAKKVKKAA